MLAMETSSTKMCGAIADHAARPPGKARGMDQRDRAAIAVADQEHRLARGVDVQRGGKRGQHLVRLAVHESTPSSARSCGRGVERP